jgi:hypothetical protein
MDSVVSAGQVREATDDARLALRESEQSTEGDQMEILAIIAVFAFVFGTLSVVAYALYEVSPFAHHAESFRDARTGKRRWESPRLD